MHNVCQLLPPQEQTKFDQVAAKVIGECKELTFWLLLKQVSDMIHFFVVLEFCLCAVQRRGPVRSGIGEQVEDVLYRVQGMQLGAEDKTVGRSGHRDQTRKIGIGRLDSASCLDFTVQCCCLVTCLFLCSSLYSG